MNPLTTALLRVLREIDESRLRDGHVILRPEPGAEANADYPLDLAVYAWRDAGCPDVEAADDSDEALRWLFGEAPAPLDAVPAGPCCGESK